MQQRTIRLRKVQHMAHQIMDEMNFNQELRESDTLRLVIDSLSRAVGDLADPSGNYSLNYLEEKVGNAHSLIFNKHRQLSAHIGK
ncbi:hypothetical protein ACFFIX_21910 [Metabacillus herbersteinensis]|uniref:Group-specific protein n=1 Tax=Metabacillus herbersteinensis TaxID=283816 RepID=A0ABV6GLK2_9BACI